MVINVGSPSWSVAHNLYFPSYYSFVLVSFFSLSSPTASLLSNIVEASRSLPYIIYRAVLRIKFRHFTPCTTGIISDYSC